jgi:hypothetical protein
MEMWQLSALFLPATVQDMLFSSFFVQNTETQLQIYGLIVEGIRLKKKCTTKVTDIRVHNAAVFFRYLMEHSLGHINSARRKVSVSIFEFIICCFIFREQWRSW